MRRTERGGAEAGVALDPAAGPRRDEQGAVHRYEDLDGAVGRSVFFRPERHRAEALAPLQGAVTVTLAGMNHECALVDISQNGVAVVWPEWAPVASEQRVEAVIHFDDHVAFRGEARVGSVRARDGGVVVGLSFLDFLLDVDELLQLRRVRSWAPAGAGTRVAGKAWRVAGGDRFKALVAELRLYLVDAAEQLRTLEAELPWRVLHGPDHPARAALVARLCGDFVEDAVALSEAIDGAVRELPAGHLDPEAKAWSLRHVHEFLMQAPILHRARHKPFGYPGDYEVMNFIYTRNFEGDSLFARAVSLAFTRTCAARAVRHRKDLVKRQLRALLESRAGAAAPVRVLSIASGPAQELFELLSEAEGLPAPLEVVLFEQDKQALAHAWRRLSALAEARFPGRVSLTFLHDSIKRLLRDRDLFAPFGKFDLVYSCGLFDYLARSTAVSLSRRLARSLRPGGRLLAANMVDHPTRWIMEHHLDWPLIYRSREELLDIGREAVPGAQVRLLEEETGANPFFELVHA